MKIYYVTGNLNKLKEAKEILPNIEGLQADLTEIQSLDAQEIIKYKLEEAKKLFPGKNLIVDDVSFHFDCLGNLPGPFIKFFLKTLGLEGIVKLVNLYGNNKSIAKATLGLFIDGKIEYFDGITTGKIVESRGKKDFGWDSIFHPDGYNQTYAEMGSEKNKISHRRIALEKLSNYLKRVESFKND